MSSAGRNLIRRLSTPVIQVFAHLRSEGISLSTVADSLGITKGELERLVFGLVPTALAGGSEASAERRATLSLVRP
jgi:hypothetical protein